MSKIKQLWLSFKGRLTINTLKTILRSGEAIHLLIAWLVVSFGMILTIMMMVHAFRQLRAGELTSAVVSSIVALITIGICLAADRYTSGESPTGGGKNP